MNYNKDSQDSNVLENKNTQTSTDHNMMLNPFMYSSNKNNKSNKNNEDDEKDSKDNDNNDDEMSQDNIKELGTVTDISPEKDICFVSIIGEVEGHTSLPPQSKTTKYEHIIPLLIGAEMDPNIKGILLLINTIGGDVEAGLAISELINSLNKPTVSLVLGGGHSIGTALAVSAKYSFIAPTGTMTIHPIRTNGFVIGVPQTFRYFQKMQERITNFIVNNSKVDREKLLKYMYDTDEIANDVGTVLNADEVVSLGLIDEIGGFNKSMDLLRKLINDKKNAKNNTTKREPKNWLFIHFSWFK